MIEGRKTVSSAQRPEALVDVPVSASVLLAEALPENAGDIFLGGKYVQAAEGAYAGIRLSPGDKIVLTPPLLPPDLSHLKVAVRNADDGLIWSAS